MEKSLTYTAGPADEGRAVKDVLTRTFALSARAISRAKFAPSGITVNGDRVTVRYALRDGDRLEVILESAGEASENIIPVPGELDIRYEDEDLVLVNKPAGMVVHPSPGHYTDSLANILVWHYAGLGENIVVRPVGRLDRETSGLIFMAKNRASAARMEREREEGTLSRNYLAFAEGCPEPESGLIELPIEEDPSVPLHFRTGEGGLAARTAYRVLRRYEGYSLIGLHLFTGRTHQIRVHLSAVGHPLLGDVSYGGSVEYGIGRCALHSYRICCRQPFTGVRICVSAPLPGDMRALCADLPL